MSASDGAGAIVGGLILTVFAGILNGSWNASFNPKVALAVGSTSTDQTEQLGRRKTALSLSLTGRLSESLSNLRSARKWDIDYHYAWMLFQLYASIINIVLCLLWAGGPKNVSYVVSQSSVTSIVLLVVFSFLWGIGSVLFGLACRIAGVGLGTNLTMGVILVLGTFLPLAYDGGIKSATGGLIMAGLVVCCIGLYFSTASLRIRDLDAKSTKQPKAVDSQKNAEGNGMTKNDCDMSSDPSQIEQHTGIESMPCTAPSNGSKAEDTTTHETPEYSTLRKVLVCVLAGIFATQLQFAFVFGQDLIDIAEKDGSTPKGGSAAIIWLFAVSVGCPPSIIYGLYSSPKHIPLKTIWLCSWWRHFLIILTTSIPWVAHIHLYGLAANVLLPKRFAASIAWPILMMTTVGQGMVLSLYLGEWKGASRHALSKLRIGLALVAIGVIMFMISVVV